MNTLDLTQRWRASKMEWRKGGQASKMEWLEQKRRSIFVDLLGCPPLEFLSIKT